MTKIADTESGDMAPLDEMVKAGPERAIMLLLWLNRFKNPDFAVTVKTDDLQGFKECTDYLKVTPKIIIRRPPGRAAVPAQEPTRRNPDGIPARPAEPARPYVLISMVDQDGNAFTPIENSEEKAKIRDRENELRVLKERAPMIARAVAANAASGMYSNAEITELCNAAIQLAQA